MAAVLSTGAALTLGYRPLLVPASGALTALIAGLLGTSRIAPLKVRREIAPTKVTRGEPAVAVVRVGNTGARRSRGSATAAVDRVGDREVAVPIPGLPPGVGHTAGYQLPTSRRGEVVVGPLTTRSSDAFGLFRRVQPYGQAVTLLVRPKAWEIGVLGSGRSASLEGPAARADASGTVTFHSLREYVLGDDLRHVHWRSTARAGTLMVRRLLDVSEPRTAIALATDPAGYATDDDFELAVDIAASVALSALRDGFPVTLATGEDPVLTVRGGARAQSDAVLDRLAVVAPHESHLGRTLWRATSGDGASTRGSLVVIAGALGPDEVGRVATVGNGFEHAVLVRVGTGGLPPVGAAGGPVRVLDVGSAAEFVAAWGREARR